MNYKISLTGDLGGGKSTVAQLLIQKRPDFEIYSTGTIMRKMAADKGISIEEFNKLSEKNGKADSIIDNGLRALSDDPRALIIDSRMAWHFVKDTFKVYLSCEEMSSAARIMTANRQNESFDNIDDAVNSIRERRASEKKRYKELYGVDITDMSNYNLVIDTTSTKPEIIAEYIFDVFDTWTQNHDYKICYMSPERLLYNSDDVTIEDTELMSQKLEETGSCDEITVIEKNKQFYIDGGSNSAIAYSLCDYIYVPSRIVKGVVDEKREYVKMKTSL